MQYIYSPLVKALNAAAAAAAAAQWFARVD